MNKEPLYNLVKMQKLKKEAADQNEFNGMLNSATLRLKDAKWRVLDKCHKQRNLAEYEGHLEITPSC